ncbi:MAG: hypothetical protein VB076_05090 [Synergistaceae bacterium]|nr:hypothetical protein [Synergistaceae bacterium]
MKYIEPSNSALFPAREGSYAAGNPVLGIAGSIVPPEAIEHPMREMLHVMIAAGINPSDEDLTQLKQAMRIFATCAIWPASPAEALTYVAEDKFSTTTNGAFQVDDRILINGDILALVTAVGDTSPYQVTVAHGEVPAIINSILNERLLASIRVVTEEQALEVVNNRLRVLTWQDIEVTGYTKVSGAEFTTSGDNTSEIPAGLDLRFNIDDDLTCKVDSSVYSSGTDKTTTTVIFIGIAECPSSISILEGSRISVAYIHIRWSVYSSPTDAQILDTPNDYIGFYAGTSNTAPTTAASYIWQRVTALLATVNETKAGIIDNKAATPAGVKAAIDNRIILSGGVPA